MKSIQGLVLVLVLGLGLVLVCFSGSGFCEDKENTLLEALESVSEALNEKEGYTVFISKLEHAERIVKAYGDLAVRDREVLFSTKALEATEAFILCGKFWLLSDRQAIRARQARREATNLITGEIEVQEMDARLLQEAEELEQEARQSILNANALAKQAGLCVILLREMKADNFK